MVPFEELLFCGLGDERFEPENAAKLLVEREFPEWYKVI